MSHSVPCTADARALFGATGTCAGLMLRLKPTPSAPNHRRRRSCQDITLAIGMNVLAPADDGVGSNERVFGAAMHDDTTPFARKDAVEQAWRSVDPALADDTPLRACAPPSWGPAEAQRQAPPGEWHDPVRASR
jgi:glucose-6-phosphate 1-dehydrogenase